MGFNFPSSPLVGDTYPVPPVAGVPVYVWDGEKWTMSQSPAVTDVVRYDTAQSLTATQQAKACSNIYAAPYDAMAYSGMQINGGMEVSQELGITARTTNGFICDGWAVFKSGSMGINAGISTTIAPGISNQLFTAITAAQPSLAASDLTIIYQSIEGFRISRLAWGTPNAQPITIAFWSYIARPGTYSVTVYNSPATHTYATTYTHNVANTAQYNVITIPGPTAGTWKADNGAGMVIVFAMAAGTSVIAPSANTWFAGSGYNAAPGQVNGVAATSDVFRITGVTVLPGTQAPTAAQSPNIMRPYDQELLTCQRYYHRHTQADGSSIGICYHQSTTAWNGCIYFFPVKMRASPTVTFAAASNFFIGVGGGSAAANAMVASGAGPLTVNINGTCASGLTSGQAGSISMNASGFVTCDARL